MEARADLADKVRQTGGKSGREVFQSRHFVVKLRRVVVKSAQPVGKLGRFVGKLRRVVAELGQLVGKFCRVGNVEHNDNMGLQKE